MGPLAIAGAALSIGSGLAGFGASKSAAKSAKRLMRLQLRQHTMDAAYNEEQQRLSNEQELGLIDSLIGASNIQFSGSAMSYRRAVKDQLTKELVYLKKSNEIQKDVIKEGGKAEVKSLKNQAIGSLLGAGSNALSIFG